MERLQKIIAASGLCSRRQAEKLIQEGRVLCNGNKAVLGQRVGQEDVITVDGIPLPKPAQGIYIILNKPKGYVTTLSDEKGRKNVSQLVADCGVRVFPVGRLDMDSEGLLLLTNDGDFANGLMHPSKEVDKTYHVQVKGFCEEGLKRLLKPMSLDGYRLRIPEVEVLECQKDNALLKIVIHEGRNRQVRRMCARAGMTVTRLVRVGEGPLRLNRLPAGKWRYLTTDEIELLKNEIS